MRESCIAPQTNSPTISPRRLFGSLLSLSLPSSTLTTPLSRHRDPHSTPASPRPSLGRQTPGPDPRGPFQTRINLSNGKSTPKIQAHSPRIAINNNHLTQPPERNQNSLQTAIMRDVFLPIVPCDADFFIRGFIQFGTLVVYALIAILIHKLIFDACARNVVRPARERIPGGAPGGPRADGAPEHQGDGQQQRGLLQDKEVD